MVQACVPEAFVETIELLVLVDIQCIWINWAAYNLQNKNEKHVYECYCILSQEWCVLMKYINWFVLIQYCKRCQFYLFLCVLFKVKARSSWPQFWFLLPPLYIMRGPWYTTLIRNIEFKLHSLIYLYYLSKQQPYYRWKQLGVVLLAK